MNNRWTSFFSGYVKIKVTGKLIEPFLNQCLRENIIIWNLKRQNARTITGFLLLSDIHKLRKICRKSDCKLKFVGRRGLPFLLKKMVSNSGFMIGLVMAIMITMLLSNMVWTIEITGANAKIEHDIRKELEEMGIKKGKLYFSLPDNEEIQGKLMEKLSSITWVGVKLSGTSYHLEVVEKKVAEEPELLSPRHLVAKKKAVVYDYFIEQGQPIIKVNDFVKPGQMLVSGFIGKGEKTNIVAAKGKVFGEIWYKSQITVPLKTAFSVYTGESTTKHYLDIFHMKIPIWGFGKVDYSKSRKELKENQIHFLKWNLPIVYRQEVIREEVEHIRTYDKQTAISVGKKTARNDLKARLGEDSVIKGENVLHQTIENGKVKLMIHYQVIEDIAKPQPIIQGD